MDNNTKLILAVTLLALLGLSAFFSACEMGFSSLSRIKLKNMAAKTKQKRLARRASATLKLLDTYDRLLSSVLIGNNVVNIALSAIATMLFLDLFGPKGVGIATLVVTVLVLIFGDISPKTLAKESPEAVALGTTPLLRFFVFLFSPLNFLTAKWKQIIVRLIPVKTDRSVTEDELLTFVGEVRQEGGINLHEEKMIRQVIEFDDIVAAEIVTPRIDITAVPENSTAEDISRTFAETGFSRLPVYRDNMDNITGVMLLKDFHLEVINKGRPPAEIVKPVVFVTKTMKISKLLQTLQHKKSHMAVLVDEFGGTMGIVTIEDIIEELVGEIWDEHDKVVEPFKKNADGSFSVLGNTNFQDMINYISNNSNNNAASDGENENPPYDADEIPDTTVGNWVMENAGGLPRSGEEFSWHNLRITVARIQRHRVMEVVAKAASI